ncbi:ankyrin repeat domain-containing protein [Wolbachia pipientis]|uniref:ankyrin repeat domain-containing protein n=1 Tax=Wolbachia pipientis TaxID=955 RepID=UPI0011D128F8|nr:ankyrin repeat domain-containing protein [Wolbachia pipientis]
MPSFKNDNVIRKLQNYLNTAFAEEHEQKTKREITAREIFQANNTYINSLTEEDLKQCDKRDRNVLSLLIIANKILDLSYQDLEKFVYIITSEALSARDKNDCCASYYLVSINQLDNILDRIKLTTAKLLIQKLTAPARFDMQYGTMLVKSVHQTILINSALLVKLNRLTDYSFFNDCYNDKLLPALHRAVTSGNVREVKRFIQHDKVDVNAVDQKGETALYKAVKGCNMYTST